VLVNTQVCRIRITTVQIRSCANQWFWCTWC